MQVLHTKRREARQSFQTMFDYKRTNIDLDGDMCFDLRLGRRAAPPTQEVGRNDHFTQLAQEDATAVRIAMQKNAYDTRMRIGDMFARGMTNEQIANALVNPAGAAAPQAVAPIILATPQEGWVGEAISPRFQVERSTGLYYEWTPETSHRLYFNLIGKGEEPKEIEFRARQFTYTLHEYALANRVYKRDLQNAYTNLRVQEKAMWALNNAMRLAREARVLNLALSPAVPAVAAAAAWNVAAGVPITNILAAMRTIFVATQCIPTDIMVPYHRVIEMINTTEWIARFAGTDAGFASLFSPQTCMNLLGLRMNVSKVCALTTHQGTASDPELFTSIVGNTALVWVQDPVPVENSRCFMASPYTVMNEVRSGEWDREIKTRSIYMQEYEETTELLIDANCGCRITGI